MKSLYRRMRQFHNVFGLVFGAQLVIWIVSGFFFTLYPIETVRGTHLRVSEVISFAQPEEPLLPVTQFMAGAEKVELSHLLGQPVYRVSAGGAMDTYDAVTGAQLSPIPESVARALAETHWAGDGELVRLEWVERAPAESGRPGRAMWRADFSGRQKATFWISPGKAEIVTVRTDVWRTFDLFWGLHIMDWWNRETISSWHMKLFAFGVLVLALSGVWLLWSRIRSGKLLA